MMEQTKTTQRRPLFNGEIFEKLVVLLMTLVVIQTAVVTYWFSLADDLQGDSGRDAQIFAIQGLGSRTVGSIRTGYDQSGAYQRWLELNTQAVLAEQNGDTATAERYLFARDQVAQLSPMLQPPYFDAAEDIYPAFYSYEVDTYLLESITLKEQFANQYNLKTAWFQKSNTYLVHITILAVALFLFGLSTTTGSKPARLVFSGMGGGLSLLVLVWMLITYAQPVSGLNEEAINAYARGVGLAYRGYDAEAIQAFDEALSLEPKYVNAVKERALSELSQINLEEAASGFEKALSLGDNSADTYATLGWTYYLLGRFDLAIDASRKSLAITPDETWVRGTVALSLLVTGRVDEATQEYDAMINQASDQVAQARAAGKEPPGTLWWALDSSAVDLDDILTCLDGYYCAGQWEADKITDPEQVSEAANSLRIQLKQASVALENTGLLPAEAPVVNIGTFNFTQTPPEDIEYLEDLPEQYDFPVSKDPLYILFTQEGMQSGQEAVIKVLVDGEEDPRLRVTVNIGEDMPNIVYLQVSTGGLPLDPGEYWVEMYINSYLVREGIFWINQ
jgi:tetratricopeptide (TPR) repeat protein